MTRQLKGRRASTIHSTDVEINKKKLKEILDRRGLEYIELYRRAVEKFGLDISYKGFMQLLSNNSSWKLLYAWAITDILLIKMEDVFDIIKVDVEKKALDREIWKEKYQK